LKFPLCHHSSHSFRSQDVGHGLDIYLSLLDEHRDSHSDDFEAQSALIDLLIACVDEDLASAADNNQSALSANGSNDGMSSSSADAKPAYLVNAEIIVSAGVWLCDFMAY
jgi:hypothetical protein